LKQENTFKQLDIESSKITKTQNFVSQPHSLTTFARLKAKGAILLPQFYATTSNLPVRCAFKGLFPIRFFFFLQQINIEVLILLCEIFLEWQI